jgi:hypothetical protein
MSKTVSSKPKLVASSDETSTTPQTPADQSSERFRAPLAALIDSKKAERDRPTPALLIHLTSIAHPDAKKPIEYAFKKKAVLRLAVDRYGDLAGWLLEKEDMDEADVERMQDALLGNEPCFDVCWVRGSELLTDDFSPMSIDDLPKAIAAAKAERIRFYTEREKEFGPSAWPEGSRPVTLEEATKLMEVSEEITLTNEELKERIQLMEKYLELSSEIANDGVGVDEEDVKRLETFILLSEQIKNEGYGVSEEDVERLQQFLRLSEQAKEEGAAYDGRQLELPSDDN